MSVAFGKNRCCVRGLVGEPIWGSFLWYFPSTATLRSENLQDCQYMVLEQYWRIWNREVERVEHSGWVIHYLSWFTTCPKTVPDLHIYGTVLLKLKSYFDLCQFNDNATKIRGFGSDTPYSLLHSLQPLSLLACKQWTNALHAEAQLRKAESPYPSLPICSKPALGRLLIMMWKTSARGLAIHQMAGRSSIRSLCFLLSLIFPCSELAFPPSPCWMRWKGVEVDDYIIYYISWRCVSGRVPRIYSSLYHSFIL